MIKQKLKKIWEDLNHNDGGIMPSDLIFLLVFVSVGLCWVVFIVGVVWYCYHA